MPVSIETFRHIAQSGGNQQVLLDASHNSQAPEIKTRGSFSSWVVNLFRGEKLISQQQQVAQSFVQALQDNLQHQVPDALRVSEQLKSDYDTAMQETLGAVRRQLAKQLDGTRALTANDIQLALKFVTAVQQQTLAPLLEEAVQVVAETDAATRLPEPGLPDTSAGLIQVVHDRVVAIQQAITDSGGDAELAGVAQDLADLAQQDVEPRERLQQIQARLRAAQLPLLPAGAASPLASCLTQLHVLKSGVDAHLATPVPDHEPAFLNQQEQTKALEELHVREKAVVSWNLALREARDVCRSQAELAGDRRYGDLSQNGSFGQAYFHLSHMQDSLLDPGQRLDRTFFQALELSLHQGLPDLQVWAQADGAGRLSPEERAAFSRLLEVANQSSMALAGQDDPDLRTDQWLRASAVFADRGTRMDDEALLKLEKQTLRLAMMTESALKEHIQSHSADVGMAQLMSQLVYWQVHSDTHASGLSPQARLRTLLDWGSDAAAGIDNAMRLAATRGDVQLTQSLLDLRGHLFSTQQAVYPGRIGYKVLEVSQSLREEVGRAQLRQTTLARQEAAETAVAAGQRVELPPEVPRELKAQRAVALPSGAPQASAQLAEALQLAFLRFDERGALGRKIHKDLHAKYEDKFLQAHAALTTIEASEPSVVEDYMKREFGERFWNENFGQKGPLASERLQRAVAILEPLRVDIMKDIASRKDRSDSRRVLENVLQNFVLATAVLDQERQVEVDTGLTPEQEWAEFERDLANLRARVE